MAGPGLFGRLKLGLGSMPGDRYAHLEAGRAAEATMPADFDGGND